MHLESRKNALEKDFKMTMQIDISIKTKNFKTKKFEEPRPWKYIKIFNKHFKNCQKQRYQ